MLKSSYTYEPCSDSYKVENKHAQYTTRRRGSCTESYTLLLNMFGLLKAKNHAQKGKGYFQRLRTATSIMHKKQRSLLQRTSRIDEVLSLLVCQEVYNWNAVVQEVMVNVILCNLSKTS